MRLSGRGMGWKKKRGGKNETTINFSVVELPSPSFVLMESKKGGKIDGEKEEKAY